ncbi:hypothetical protein ETB97_002408 [Aspergillus alliaceus]|uniref:Terpenoid synthase n=1 Tax=Petromyces alliaceus TaxID=209559 RepID=A0A8H6E558_PETAA|nr:hypothetical protein ETB97_002408 [Aspergillus burnettii]
MSHPKEPKALHVTKSQYEEILKDFFSCVSFEQSWDPDPFVEQSVRAQCLKHGLDQAKTHQLAKYGAAAAQWFYPKHPKDLQIAIGLFTAYFFTVDDLGEQMLDDVRNFRYAIMAREEQPPILKSFAELLSTFDKYYDTFSADKIFTGLIDFMGSCAMEFETLGKFAALESSPNFPRYFRYMTGLAEPYVYFIFHKAAFSSEELALFIQAVPDLMDFSADVNDLLSFYKESIVSNERNTAVFHQAAGGNKDVLEVLRELITRTKGYISRIHKTLAGSPTLLSYAEAYLRGFVGFHMSQSRYRLSELNIPALDAMKQII